MTKEEAVVLVRSLLERIDADVPTFTGLLSPTDRIAIGTLLKLTTGRDFISRPGTATSAQTVVTRIAKHSWLEGGS